MRNNKTTIRAFTLVEMLTTVAIIGILLAVLIPAFNQVSKKATLVKQRAQFQNIEIALETFRSDTGDYPPSEWDLDLGDKSKYGKYSAAERLAEAVVGRDGFGFHPASRFHADGCDINGNPLYAPGINPQTNIHLRKGPYLELENANAVRLSNYGAIYQTLAQSKPASLVLADSFKTAKLTTGRKTGLPILYYRANRGKTQHAWDKDYSYAEVRNYFTYNVNDGFESLPTLNRLPEFRPWFYQRTRNPELSDPVNLTTWRPYRAESFILHSAGPDGFFGTTDDMFNFDERE
jgi:prepilin-type N-terminal cleavage/methylation domain-containing protein